MNDERFERDLIDLLRDIAGREAPLSLRDRVTRMLDEAPVGRRVWFAAPLRLSLAAVVVVAIVAVAIIASQPRQVGPLPSASPGTPAPSAETSPGSTPTQAPTPTPAVAWTGLDWSIGVAGPTTSTGRVVVRDIIRWGNGYVGVGEADGNDGTVAAAFLTSPDGQHWTIAQLGEPSQSENEVQDAGQSERLLRVVRAGDGLLAAGLSPFGGTSAPKLWWAGYGHSWTPVDSPSWRDAWDPKLHEPSRLISLASGPSGIVALGMVGGGCCAGPDQPPVIVTSSDGQTWTRLELSSVFDHAHVLDLTTYGGAFVMVGYTGDYHFDADMQNLIGTSAPAAWISTDGQTWRSAAVEGDQGTGVKLLDVVAGAGGLFAVGRRAGAPALMLAGDGVGATTGWASSDGLTWRQVGDLGADLPDVVRLAGDGSHMVLLGRESCKATSLLEWSSTNGVTWTGLEFSGSTSIPTILGPICQNEGTEGWSTGVAVAFAAVVPNGVIVVGTGGAPGQIFWFASATGS